MEERERRAAAREELRRGGESVSSAASSGIGCETERDRAGEWGESVSVTDGGDMVGGSRRRVQGPEQEEVEEGMCEAGRIGPRHRAELYAALCLGTHYVICLFYVHVTSSLPGRSPRKSWKQHTSNYSPPKMLRLCRTCRVGAYAPRRTLATAAAAGPDLPPGRPQAQLQRPDRAGRERDRFRAPNNKLRLADILQTLAKYKAENRSPTPVAYINIIEAASEFALGHRVDGDQGDGLGFQVALAAWEDAKRGGVELGQEGIDAMMNVGRHDVL